ncbi:MAG: NUDIX domain-containing protein [Bacteroidetes bacterium]|nr:NUDIX domain-containing protein [Bacteroidota bacterium]
MSKTKHFSAGGIVLKKIKNEYMILLVQHSKHKGWDFPKGHLNKGETSEQAAIREVGEETGVVGEILEKAGQTQYFFTQDGEKIFKTVNFFFMKFVEQKEATTAEEVMDEKWLSVEEVESQLTFKGTIEMWNKIKGKDYE